MHETNIVITELSMTFYPKYSNNIDTMLLERNDTHNHTAVGSLTRAAPAKDITKRISIITHSAKLAYKLKHAR